MNYNETLEYIHSVNWCFCKPGLERIKELCEALGNPQDSLKFIHVAGTNGKGSFCSMLSSVLKSGGYKVGTFTSPYVLRFNERMSVNGEDISDDELCSIIERIKPIADKMTDKPTEFELITAAAFLYFYEKKCDLVVLECGLGGRLDSTNVIKTPLLSVITGIALDHTAVLGETVAEIAYEKAGIIKENAPVLWCGSDDEATAVIEKKAAEQSAPLYCVDRRNIKVSEFSLAGTVFSFNQYKNVRIKLLGEYQIDNAANVLSAIDILKNIGIEISDEALFGGMESAVWHSRFEIISENPLIIADGGHNPEGVVSAVKSIKKYFGSKKVNILTGVMKDKDYRFIAKEISSVANEVFCITPDNPRALDAEELSRVYKDLGISSKYFEDVQSAFFAAAKVSKKQDTPLICLGSLYMYSEIHNANQEYIKNEP